MQVVGHEVVSQDSLGLQHFLLAALLTPHSLGIAPTEDESARKAAADARVSISRFPQEKCFSVWAIRLFDGRHLAGWLLRKGLTAK